VDLYELQSTFGIPEQAASQMRMASAETLATQNTEEDTNVPAVKRAADCKVTKGLFILLPDHAEACVSPIVDSKKGIYSLGFPHWRLPRVNYWDANGQYQVPLTKTNDEPDGETQFMHWTTRLRRQHPAVLPLNSLDNCKRTQSDEREMMCTVPPPGDLPDNRSLSLQQLPRNGT
jgi:hypothetical protein